MIKQLFLTKYMIKQMALC